MPVFEPGAIPPVFGPESPDPNEFETIEAPVSSELDLSNLPNMPVLSAATVPAPSPSRGERLRKLLGNFLQNFGEGLQAASRAPSGSELAAALGGALSAPAERRRQQVFADLQRANQAFRQRDIELREERLAQNAAQFQQSFEFTKTQAKRPRTFEAFAVNLLQAGDEAGARRIIELARGNPQGRLVTRQAGQDLVGLDPTTLEEITRLPDFFPAEVKAPTFAERRSAQRQRVNTMGAAFLVQTGGDVRAAIKLARESVKIDPQGFTAKNFAEIMRAIRSGNTSSAIEILRDALREQQPR
jgi:tetratricopeptide (TPR) repeat protein